MNIGVANSVNGAGRTNVDVGVGNTELLSDVGNGSILNVGIGTLGQSVFNTGTESLK